MSAFVWVMMGIAIWHGCVLIPDRFHGGLIGAFVTAVGGAFASGFLLPSPGIPPHNPPGLAEALWPIPGCVAALAVLWWYGNRKELAAEAAAEQRLRGGERARRERDTRARAGSASA